MSEKITKNLRKRTLSRLIAIQVFYQYEFFERKKDITNLKNEILENYALEANETISSYRKKVDEVLIDNLLNGILQDEEKIKKEITTLLKEGYYLENLEEVLRHLILIAAFEINNSGDTPLKVIISEYVDIAAAFFPDKKITFVNGILENLGKNK